MSVGLRNLAALLLLAAAASLSWYFSRSPEQPRRAAGNGEPGLLGYYLRDATLLGTDESGRALVRIHTAEAVQEHGQGLTLTGVRIEYRDEQAVGWTISAELARAPGDLGHVDLERVRLERGESGRAHERGIRRGGVLRVHGRARRRPDRREHGARRGPRGLAARGSHRVEV